MDQLYKPMLVFVAMLTPNFVEAVNKVLAKTMPMHSTMYLVNLLKQFLVHEFGITMKTNKISNVHQLLTLELNGRIVQQ